MTTTIFGIKNCSTMKRTFDKLKELGIEYEFFDYKKQSLDKSTLQDWVRQKGIDKVLNKRSTTWRNLTNIEKQQAEQNETLAIDLMIASPSLIKRPIIISGNNIIVGYDEARIEALK